MKSVVHVLLILSLAANLGFGFVIWRKRSSRAHTLKQERISTHNNPTKAAASSPLKNDRKLWQRLGSNDLSQLVANLRTAGLPPQQIARIINNLLAEKYAPKFDAVFSGKSDTPYWRTPDGYYYSELSKTGREQQRQLWDERRAEEMRLLGNDYWLIEEDPFVDLVRRQHGNLSPEKLSAIQKLQLEYSAMSRSLEQFAHDLRSPSDTEKIKLLDKEFRNDLATLLTPEELLERDLRSSNAGQLLQLRCNFFAATESEYRALFPLYQQIDRAVLVSDWDDPDEKTKAARLDAETRAHTQIEAILGPARYAEFKQANDKNAYKENQLITRLGLPLSAAAQLCSLKSDLTARAEHVRKTNALSPEQQASQLADLKTEAQNRIIATIGEQGLNAYQQHGGNWLQSISPSPKKTP